MRGFGLVTGSRQASAARPERRPLPTDPAGVRSALQTTAILRFRLAAIFAAQLFDFVTFTVMVERHGIGAELNPIVAAGFVTGGLPILLVVKLALIVLVGSTIVILGRPSSSIHVSSRLAAVIAVAAVVGGVFGGFTNAITI